MDRFILKIDKALKVISGIASAERPNPSVHTVNLDLTTDEQRRSAGLMRVNHVGEVCAQALYEAQGTFANNVEMCVRLSHAAREEEDHLAWTAQRLEELGSHTSFLNPIWYGGAYALGMIAARLGDAKSLAFIVETERQVEVHLTEHLERLPTRDLKSRVIVEQMRKDEAAHSVAAKALGAVEMPWPARQAMRVMSKVMTSVAYYV
jgi:ubiquinone biosynthesis monooxygenase Coq7